MSKTNQKPSLDASGLVSLLKVHPEGILKRNQLHSRWSDVNEAIRQARARREIGTYNELIYDQDRLDKDAVAKLADEDQHVGSLPDFLPMVHSILESANEPALVAQDIQTRMGEYFNMGLLSDHSLEKAGIQNLELKLFQPYTDWYYLGGVEHEAAYDYALATAQARQESDWQNVLDWAGDNLREGATEGEDSRAKALARLYSRGQAEAILPLPERIFQIAIRRGLLARKTCPDGAKRMRAMDVHALRDNPEILQNLEDQLEINIFQIRNLTDLKISYLRTLLHNQGIRPTNRTDKSGSQQTVWYRWGDVRTILWPEGDHPTFSDIEIIEDTGGTGREAWWSEKIISIHRDIEERRVRQGEAREQRHREREQQREALRSQMIDNFPNWLRDEEVDQIAYIHVGPTNSGKTHDALQELANAGSGWYLAPLRLLAREMFETLNKMGTYCNLLTGEERIDIPGARVTAATVEMFNPDRSGDCVVIDEAHLVADDQRGWAWTRALVNARAPQLRVITAPHGLPLLTKIFENRGIETQTLIHERMVPLEVATEHWPLHELPRRTILIAFTRRDVLRVKHELQQMGRSVSVVYGALPPEVRLKQAQRFAYEETEICVATDAVGMGLNLPADNVVFTTLDKFDGVQRRRINSSELQQIAGRAGRYGFSTLGTVNGVSKDLLDHIRRIITKPIADLEVARLAPRTDEIVLLEGDLAQRLITWQQLNAIPEALRDILTSTDLTETIELARFLSYQDLMKLGVERALLLVSAPVRHESQEYWIECATAILQNETMPQPPPSPNKINEGRSLKLAEAVIACIDIYLWLGYRESFRHLAENVEGIIEQRADLTREIDLALMRKFDPDAFAWRRGNVYDGF
jgi:hypothetical protein